MILDKKTILTASIAAMLASVFTIFVTRLFLPPSEIILKDGNGTSRFANYNDMMLSGNMQRNFVSSAPTNFIAAAENITPSVVNIKALVGDSGFFGSDNAAIEASSGSGVIITGDGYIVTNSHVVENAKDIQVTLDDKREFSAKLVGSDPMTDLAVLKIEARNLPLAHFGNSDSIRVGEWVLAVGNPFNLESTVTAGIVSAKARSINILEGEYTIESFIQTDAMVNPGNSGGALVNTNGELVGINTAIITKSGRYEGYSFAIPANLAMKVVRDLIKDGVVQRGFLGVEINDLTPALARAAGHNAMNGAYIYKVNPKTGAADAGLRQADIIIGIDGNKVKNKAELTEYIGRKRPGETVKVEIVRNGERRQLDVVLKNYVNTTALLPTEKFDGSLEAFKKIGISDLRSLSQKEAQKIGMRGIRVEAILQGSNIAKTNMEIGFIITHINSQKVETIEQAQLILNHLSGKIVLEGMYENLSDSYLYTFNKM